LHSCALAFSMTLTRRATQLFLLGVALLSVAQYLRRKMYRNPPFYLGSQWRKDLQMIWALPGASQFGPPPRTGKWYRLLELIFGEAIYMTYMPKVPGTKEPDVLLAWKELMNDKRFTKKGLVKFSTFNPLFFNSKSTVFVWDIAMVKELLSKERFGDFYKGMAYDASHPLIGDGLLATPDSETWRNQRKIAQTGFRLNILETAVVQTRNVCTELFARWDEIAESGKPFELYDEMLKVTIDVLGKVAFSYDFNSVTARETKDAPLYDTFKIILSILSFRTKINALNITQLNDPEFDEKMGYLDKIVNDLVTTRRADLATKGRAEKMDLLESMMNASSLEGSSKKLTPLTNQQVADNIKTFLFAGHDTTASALTWAIYLLSLNPAVRKKLDEEIDANISSSFFDISQEGIGDVNYNKLQKMPYLNAVINETLRLYPSAGFTRTPVKTTTLGPYSIPKNVEIVVFPWLVHRHPDYYEEPEKYDPERWIGSREKTDKNKSFFCPFSLGNRNCVGLNLAYAELRVVLPMILKRYNFRLADGADNPGAVVYLTVCPSPVSMVLERRDQD